VIHGNHLHVATLGRVGLFDDLSGTTTPLNLVFPLLS
jgi:hypothetical protein